MEVGPLTYSCSMEAPHEFVALTVCWTPRSVSPIASATLLESRFSPPEGTEQ